MCTQKNSLRWFFCEHKTYVKTDDKKISFAQNDSLSRSMENNATDKYWGYIVFVYYQASFTESEDAGWLESPVLSLR